jgi:hypothetical protein
MTAQCFLLLECFLLRDVVALTQANTAVLQYRLARTMCAWRIFHEDNSSEVAFNNYALETLLHELLLQSNHRWVGLPGAHGSNLPHLCPGSAAATVMDAPTLPAGSRQQSLHQGALAHALSWLQICRCNGPA